MKIKFNQKMAGPWGASKPGDVLEIEDAQAGDELPQQALEDKEAFKKRRDRHLLNAIAGRLLIPVPDVAPQKVGESADAFAARKKTLIPKFAEKVE